jgi:hypothetical protein
MEGKDQYSDGAVLEESQHVSRKGELFFQPCLVFGFISRCGKCRRWKGGKRLVRWSVKPKDSTAMNTGAVGHFAVFFVAR